VSYDPVFSMNPPKPLKILTIDGGGLQAISTLLILNKLLVNIAQNNRIPHQKPRPCDVFDVIAGIGTGGWLALLLGRFHMDITTALSEWFNIMQCIVPRSKREKMRTRVFQHCDFDQNRLVEEIDNLAEVYETGKTLWTRGDDYADIRTRYVFVAALRADAKEYNLFRSYSTDEAVMPDKLLPGPENPDKFEISRAFAVTSASRYFTPSWKERMDGAGKTRFSDTRFPHPHNITELALNEVWAMKGTEVQLSIVVNIGPGLPDKNDVKQMARRFSWGKNVSSSGPAVPIPKIPIRITIDQPPSEGHSNGVTTNPSNQTPHDGTTRARRRSPARTGTFGSVAKMPMKEKLRRDEANIELNIVSKLDNIYGENHNLYFRLAPEFAPQGTTKDDSSAARISMDATDSYLDRREVNNMMDEVASIASHG
jgi:hypothetical protein